MNHIMNARHIAVLTLVTCLLAGCNAKVKVDVPLQDSTDIINDTVASGDRDTVVAGADQGGDHTGANDSAQDGDNDQTDATPRDSGSSATTNMRVSSPRAGDFITSNRFTLRGECRTFENTGNYRLRSADGATLAEGHFTATGEMGKFSPYSTTVVIKIAYTGNGMLEVFESSAKDGSEINKVRVPLRIRTGPQNTSPRLAIYFTNSQRNPGASDCRRVFAVTRSAPATSAVARAALEQLLQGPTSEERQQTFDTEIPTGTRLRGIVINDAVAHADFSRELNAAAGSCRVTAIRAQIEQTLRQFPTVKRVVISVEGDSRGVLQP